MQTTGFVTRRDFIMMKLEALARNKVVSLVTETLQNWVEDKALRLAAALAYYSVFSIAPLLIIAVSIAGIVFGVEAVHGQLDDQLNSIIGAESARTVQSMVQSAAKPRSGWMGSVIGFAVLLVGASGVFAQLKDALNTIWEVTEVKGRGFLGFICSRLLNFGMVLCIGFLLLTSLILSTAIAALNQYLGSLFGIPSQVWAIVAFIMSLAMVTGLFAVIFKVLPDAKVRWRDVWVGALVTGLLFEVGKWALGWYLGRESTASPYGAAASVVLLLLWIYYTSCILLLGAEFTQVYARAMGHPIEPSDHGVAVTAERRAQEGMASTRKVREEVSI